MITLTSSDLAYLLSESEVGKSTFVEHISFVAYKSNWELINKCFEVSARFKATKERIRICSVSRMGFHLVGIKSEKEFDVKKKVDMIPIDKLDDFCFKRTSD